MLLYTYRVCVFFGGKEVHYDIHNYKASFAMKCRNHGYRAGCLNCCCGIRLPREVVENMENYAFTFIYVKLMSAGRGGDHIFNDCFFNSRERFSQIDMNRYIDISEYKKNPAQYERFVLKTALDHLHSLGNVPVIPD